MRATTLCVFLFLGLVAVLAIAEEPVTTSISEGEEPVVEVPLVIPSKAKARKNPLPATDDNLERGTTLYTSQCAMCHGRQGRGDGEIATKYTIKMPDFSDPKQQAGRTDGELFYILTEGHGQMPGEGDRLPEDFRWSMVLAVRSMARR